MRFIFIILVFLNVSGSYCQTLTIDYKFALVDDKDEYGVVGFGMERVTSNARESLIYSRSIDTVVVLKNREENHAQEATDFSVTRYRNFIEGVSYEPTLFPGYLLKDDSYKIKWTVTKSSKKILGYNCQEAKADYRGRSYTAYFTPEIPTQSGPHNFDGLPGMILEVYSNDMVVQFRAFQIAKTNEKIENPYVDSKYINWQQFTKAYKDYFEKMINYKPDENTTFSVPNRGIEIYVN